MLVILLGTLLSAAEWNARPFPDWSGATVLRLLTDSPWAKAKTAKFAWIKPGDQPFSYKDVPGASGPTKEAPTGSPVGGIGGRPKERLPQSADLIIRWSNALPVRHAKALFQKGEDKTGKPLNAWIDQPQNAYVLEIFGVPAVIAHKGAGSIELLARRSAYLRTRDGRTIRPSSARIAVGGDTLSIFIHFPRNPVLRIEDREIECYADFQVFEIKEKFKLGPMVYQERLEI